jgi:predicted O-linked N-acetylglucosamine transferase (SPINDLY family)
MNRTQRRAAAAKPISPAAALFARARAIHSSGGFADAEALYREALAADPVHAESLHLLGVLLCQTGRAGAAVALIARAVALAPREPAYHGNLGNALRGAGRLEEAIAAHRRAIALKPDFADAHSNLGNALKDMGDRAGAIGSYRRALAINPEYFDAFLNLALALRENGDFEAAVAAARRALALRPDSEGARLHLGAALADAGRRDEAIDILREAARRDPGSAAAHFHLGNVLNDLGRFEEAEESFSKTVAIEPGHVHALNNLGVVRAARGRRALAIEAYRRALAIRPGHAEAYNNMGGALRGEGRIADAEACYREAARLRPGFAEAHNNRGTALYELGQLDDAFAAYREALRIDAASATKRSAGFVSNWLMTRHYDPRVSNAELIAEARRHGEAFAEAAPGFANDRSAARRLRVGYVSGDFRQHAVGFFLASALEARNREAFEVFLYSNNTTGDDWTRRLAGAADQWREIAGVPDAAAADMIRADGIDILVDLSGHTAMNRLPLFAPRPAPVQASWLGYFGSTGLAAIDYLVMDRFAIPEGEERAYPEAIVRLPRGRFCYTPPDYAPAPVDPPSLANRFVTFGSFNHVAKLGDPVLALWAELLKANPASRLILKWKTLDEEPVRLRVLGAFAARGVAPDRVELRGFSPHREMLAQYGEIDVALDPFPFGGGLTSCEALWMGLPVVTLPGDRPASRQTMGFLDAAGLSECVASSPEDYVARATALGAGAARRRELRHALRGRMAASSLCDGPRFARGLEAAYATMWRRWAGGAPREGFDVAETDGA